MTIESLSGMIVVLLVLGLVELERIRKELSSFTGMMRWQLDEWIKARDAIQNSTAYTRHTVEQWHEQWEQYRDWRYELVSDRYRSPPARGPATGKNGLRPTAEGWGGGVRRRHHARRPPPAKIRQTGRWAGK
jgi:hypothetical protein